MCFGFLLFSFHLAFSVSDFWQEHEDFYLNAGINVTCLPLTKAYQSTCTGTSCSISFNQIHQLGYSQVIYTFNLYYQEKMLVKFSENGLLLEQNYLEEKTNFDKFLYCNSNCYVEYFKIFSDLTQNANPLTFSITSDKPLKFIITTLKIYVHHCQKYCLKCDNKGQCDQCLPGFSIQVSSNCNCYNDKPYFHEGKCISKCPIGFYPNSHLCLPYNKIENIFFDDQANKFIFHKDFNTTDRTTSFTDNGKLYAGLFFQNEAITYHLDKPIDIVQDIQLTFEIFVINLEISVNLFIKFDDYIYNMQILNQKIPNVLINADSAETCSLLGYKLCLKYKFNFYISKINTLKEIALYFNLPLHNSNISWALSYLKIDKIENTPKATCLQKIYNNECVEECPPTSKQVGQMCQNINSQYPFGFIAIELFTKAQKISDITLENSRFFNLCENLSKCIFQFYQNQYIFGGHGIWNKQFFLQELYLQNRAHYKIKIYMKILLIDPVDDLDTFFLQIEDKNYSISKSHPNSTCINNIGSGSCLKQEDIGAIATDYIIQIEIELDLRTNSLALGFKCNAQSSMFYCAFYDQIVLLAQCPMHCLQCTTSNDCIPNPMFSLQQISYSSCPEGYGNEGGICTMCKHYCKSCYQGICLACNDNYEMINGNCVCKYNRVNADYTDCNQQCGGSCSICLFTKMYYYIVKVSDSSMCFKCNIEEKKVQSGNQCACLDGYFMDLSTFFYQCLICNLTCKTCNEGQNCLTCNSEQNREIYENRCNCKQGYFQIDQNSPNCEICSPTCKTCINSIDMCTSCFSGQFRVLSKQNTCDCQQGYFEDENQFCQKCNNNCNICLNNNTCLSCDSNLFRELNLNSYQCECKENYYENENNECRQCYYTCSKCNNSDNSNTCTQCPQTRMKNSNLLQTFECLCKIGQYDIGDLQCLSCQDLINPPQDHYCYSKCGDQIVQWNEECDDGNLNPRDECDECYFSITSCTNNSNCINCQYNKCFECIEGYYLNKGNICEQCADQCLTCSDSKNKCNECKYKNDQNSTCILCSPFQGFQYINSKCYSICGDGIKTQEEECDDGNLLNNDGCDQYCLIEQGYVCHSSCAATSQIKIILQKNQADSIYDGKREIFLFLNQLVQIQGDQELKDLILVEPVQEDLKIQNIQIIDNTQYNLDFNLINISIIFELEDSYSQPQIQVMIENSSLIKTQNLEVFNKPQEQITLIDFKKQDSQTLKMVQNVNSLVNYLLYIMLGFAVSAVIFGCFSNFINFFETLQIIIYLKYINVPYPYYLKQYLSIHSFAEFRFIQTHLKFNDYISKSIKSSLPLRFEQEGYSRTFLINIVSVLAIAILLFIKYKFINILLQFLQKIIYIAQKRFFTILISHQLQLFKTFHRQQSQHIIYALSIQMYQFFYMFKTCK